VRLAALYDYMAARLLHANLHNDQAALAEVGRLLGEIKTAWEEIADDPAVASRNKVAA
jgi:flagellar protein FliS